MTYAEVIAFLQEHGPGKIIDFGCGAGDLVPAIQQETAWVPIGVEFDPSVAGATAAGTGADVFTYADVALPKAIGA